MTCDDGAYPELELGPARPDRPFVAINMVVTIDGKSVSGGREEPVQDLGSDFDHATMRQIESCADAVLIGAGSLRATRNIRFREGLKRVVATTSGNVPSCSAFFTQARESSFVATASGNAPLVPTGLCVIECGEREIDWSLLLKTLRREHAVGVLLVEGGSELNACLLSCDLVDEIFVTIAPKVKLGRSTPTLAGGDPFAREHMLKFGLVSCNSVGDEIFARYKRHR